MIKRLTTISIATLVAIALTACSTEKKEAETKTYKMSAEEVYKASCTKCHGAHGEGKTEKKTPRFDDKTAAELEYALFDIKKGGITFTTGTDHEIMEHNMQKLIDQGYDYDIKSMAQYIHSTFKK
ncbi:MAG TPA: c-type cytochrome [Bacteroidetes bacterium]|nr:c-type cytochrome [Bacteroidota bacterium]